MFTNLILEVNVPAKAPVEHFTIIIFGRTELNLCQPVPEVIGYLRRMTNESYMASPSTIERKWYVVDADGMTLGRLASETAKILRGKINPPLHLIWIPVIM